MYLLKTKRADWLFIVSASLVWAVALVITARDFRKRVAERSFRFGTANAVGLALMVSGVGLRMLARRALGRQFSYALRTLDDHALITDDIYGYVRHPAYIGDLMFHFGVPLLFSSGRGLIAMLLLIPCMLYRIGIEENMLTERFGDTYRNYQLASKKLLPFVY